MEILAPAGGMDSLKAAVAHGADAVYLGASSFSARAKAENFEGDTLKKAIDFAHLFGVKVYVTVNTLVKDCEMDDALHLIKRLREYNADAVIIQDLGLVQQVRQTSDIILHASTQMGVHNLNGALVAKDLGLSRVVVSRETSIKDIEKISKIIETEVFVQGALCVAFSGNCYFSSMVSGYSGNRGKCLQLCRKLYECEGKKDYRLSTSDMMLAFDLDRLKNAGVCSLKIEGRMRRPEYVASAVDLYKKSLNAAPIPKDIQAIKTTYNRGDYNRAYFFEPTAKVIYPQVQGHIGVPIGKIKRADKRIFVADTLLRAGNGYKLLRKGKECGGAKALKDSYECGYIGSAMAGDEIRLTTDQKLSDELLSKKRKLFADADIKFSKQQTELRLTSGNVSVAVVTDAMPIAKSISSENEAERLLRRSGDSEFEINEVKVEEDYPAFLIKSKINELRRNGIKLLSRAMIDDHEKRIPHFDRKFEYISDKVDPLAVSGIIAQVEYPDIPRAIYDASRYIIVNPTEYSLKNLALYADKDKFILNMPVVARDEEAEILKNIVDSGIFDKFVVNNLYGLSLCKGYKVLLGYGMNMINSAPNISRVNPFENDSLPSGALPYIYCNPPLMTFCHCPKKSAGGNCDGCKGYSITLTDEKKEKFILRRYKIKYCYSQLLPQKPFYFGNNGNGVIDLTGIDRKDYGKVFDDAISGNLPISSANMNRGLK